jgi:hypothetical protein
MIFFSSRNYNILPSREIGRQLSHAFKKDWNNLAHISLVGKMSGGNELLSFYFHASNQIMFTG